MPTYEYHAIRAEGDDEKSFIGGVVVAQSRKDAKEKLRGRGLKATMSCEVIDLQTGMSTSVPALRQPLVHGTAHSLGGGKAVIIGGGVAKVFDLRKNAWVKHIQLRAKRQSHASARLPDGRVLIAGGVGEASIELLDINAGVSRMLAAKLPDGVDDLAVVAMNNKEIWLIGGQYKGGWTTDRTWIVDLSNPKRAVINDGPRLGVKDGVADACVARVDHWIIVAGGESERQGRDTELARARVINTKTRKAYSLPDMRAKHDDAFSITTQRGMIIFGGYAQGGFNLPIAVSAVERFEIPRQAVREK